MEIISYILFGLSVLLATIGTAMFIKDGNYDIDKLFILLAEILAVWAIYLSWISV